MIAYNCGQHENPNAAVLDDEPGPIAFQTCNHINQIPSGYIVDLPYEPDGITPIFDELFEILAEQERIAPSLDQP